LAGFRSAKSPFQDKYTLHREFAVLSVDVEGQPLTLDFATKFRLVRTLLNWRQIGMCDIFGVNKDTISAWETGMREPSAKKQRLLTIFAEREGLTWNERGYPEYAVRTSFEPPAVE
jgi:DNA-binding XRE family transcriptional regulator